MHKLLIVLVIVIVIGGVGYFLVNKNLGNQPQATVSPSPTVELTPNEFPISGSTSPTPKPTVTSTRTPVPSTSLGPTPTASATPTSTPTPTPLIHSVTINNFAYDKQVITVRKGDTVTWTNKDSAPHTVTGDGGLDSSMLNLNAAYSFTFNNTGTFNYHCTPHPYMTGTVIVTQ